MLLALLGAFAAAAPFVHAGSLHAESRGAGPFDVTTLPDGRVVEAESKAGPSGEPVRHGSYTVTAADGTKLVAGEFKDGERSGRWVFRHANGEVAAAGKYKDGRRISSWRTHWEDGTKRSSGKFRSGAPAGAWTFYDRSGDADDVHSGVITLVRGTSPLNGVTYEGSFLDGEIHGTWRLRWPDGSPMYEGAFVRGRPIGDHRFGHVGGVEDAKFIGPEEEGTWTPCGIRSEPDDLGDFARADWWDARGTAAGLSTLGEAASAMSDRERSALERMAQDYAERDGTVPVDVACGAARWALVELASAGSASAESWSVVEATLRPALGRVVLGWREPKAEGAADANALALLRSHSLFALFEHSEAFWRIDAQLPPPVDRSRGAKRPKKKKARPEVEPRVVRIPILDWLAPADRPGASEGGAKFGGRRSKRDADRSDGDRRAAHDRALRWLASVQEDDGRWSAGYLASDGSDEEYAEMRGHDAGVTGLVLVAMMRDGNTTAAGPYADSVAAGLRWLISLQEAKTGRVCADWTEIVDGREVVGWINSLWIYDHAIATWVIAEAVQRESTPRLRQALEGAVGLLMEARSDGTGWRYEFPGDGHCDTSVTTWAVRALVAAERVGVDVDPTYKGDAIAWVDRVTDADEGRVGYFEAGSSSARVPAMNDHFPVEHTEALTACGLLIRAWLRPGTESEGVGALGANLIASSPPEWDAEGLTVDYYYWFMGSEVLRAVGGPRERGWRTALAKALVRSQRDDGDLEGSWDSVGAWSFAGGRIYGTAMAALSLGLARSDAGDG